MQVNISANNKAINEVFEKLIAKGQNLAPVMAEIANLLDNTVHEAFESETSPIDGTPWQELSPVTLAFKNRHGTNKGKLLHDRGTMQSSVGSDHSRTTASVGVNAKANGYPYPAVHQFGTDDGKIPARPFLPIDDDGNLPRHLEIEILEILEDFLND